MKDLVIEDYSNFQHCAPELVVRRRQALGGAFHQRARLDHSVERLRY